MSPPAFRHDAFCGSPTRFHVRDLLIIGDPRVVECHATEATIVLGSAQQLTAVDQEAARRSGMLVTRRRSGGGAVLVVPGKVVEALRLVPGV